MIKYFLISILSLLTSSVIISQDVQKISNEIHRYIFSLSSMNTPSVEDAIGICRVLVDQIKKKNKRVEKTEVLICKNANDILDKSKNGFDLIILSSSEYLALRNRLPLQATFVSSTEGLIGFKYLLVVNKNDNINNIEQLIGSYLHILGREFQQTPQLIIDQLLRLNKLPKKELFFKNISFDPAIDNVLLPIFFKKTKAALVTQHALNFMSELNPQLKKDISIIYSSPNYLSSIACINKHNEDIELKKILMDILANLHTDPFGRQLLDLFKVEKMIPYRDEYLTEYLKLLN